MTRHDAIQKVDEQDKIVRAGIYVKHHYKFCRSVLGYIKIAQNHEMTRRKRVHLETGITQTDNFAKFKNKTPQNF